MKNNSKGFIQIIVIIIVVLLIAGGVYYYGSIKNKSVSTPLITSSPVPTIEPITASTSNWKIYTNKVYGFSVKYPPTDNISKCGGEPTASSTNNIVDGTEKACISISQPSDQTGKSIISVNIDTTSKPNDQSFDAFVKTMQFDPTIKHQIKMTTVGGRPAYDNLQYASVNTGDQSRDVGVELSPTIIVNLIGTYDDKNTMSRFDQILSTLKFTK